MARRHQAGAVKQGGSFKGRQFTAEVILWAVRWYLMFPISYRDLELMLANRGVGVDHTTIFRWIQAYAPELEKRIRPHLRPSNGSWRVDETYVKVKGRWTLRAPLIFISLNQGLVLRRGKRAAILGGFVGPIGQVETRRWAATEKTTSHAASRCSSAYLSSRPKMRESWSPVTRLIRPACWMTPPLRPPAVTAVST